MRALLCVVTFWDHRRGAVLLLLLPALAISVSYFSEPELMALKASCAVFKWSCRVGCVFAANDFMSGTCPIYGIANSLLSKLAG